MITLRMLAERRAEILRMAESYRAGKVRVFGSVARGESAAGSDVDFVVEFEPGTSLLDHGSLIMDLQDTLQCKVDVVSARGMKDRMKSRVEQEAVAL